ncbi:MAG TPA: hypothetical protein VHC18_16310, partial [Amycolatopsis sp.]|nr:hypothetical protein [Amycolatopsis sp.]
MDILPEPPPARRARKPRAAEAGTPADLPVAGSTPTELTAPAAAAPEPAAAAAPVYPASPDGPVATPA